jgi:hypothetical protein
MDNKAKREEEKKERKELNTYPLLYVRANASVQQVHRPSLFSPSFFFLFFFTIIFDD